MRLYIVAKLHASSNSCNLPQITIAGCSGRFKILVICCTPKRHWVAVLHCHFHSFDIETRKPPTQPELDHSNVFRHASGFTRSTIGLGNRLVCTRIKTKKSSRRKKKHEIQSTRPNLLHCSCNHVGNEAAIRGGIDIGEPEIHGRGRIGDQCGGPTSSSPQQHRGEDANAPCSVVTRRARDGWYSQIGSIVRSAGRELCRVSPCHSGHHRWLGSGSGVVWLPPEGGRDMILVNINNEGRHTAHPGPLFTMATLQSSTHGTAMLSAKESFKFKKLVCPPHPWWCLLLCACICRVTSQESGDLEEKWIYRAAFEMPVCGLRNQQAKTMDKQA